MSQGSAALSLVHGRPLAEEPGLGPLTIGGYLQEVRKRHGSKEAVVLWQPGGERLSWSYDRLWEQSLAVAKGLAAMGVGKGTRVGVLMTNRPEFLAALFGTSLVGGVTVALSTFSTASELEYLLKASGVSVLLYEQKVLKTDFAALLAQLEPRLSAATTGQLDSTEFPFLRWVVGVGPVGEPEAVDGATATWAQFLERGQDIAEANILARAGTVQPADPGGLFFSSGTTSLPKGIQHAHRAFAIQWWRWPRVLGLQGAVRVWTGNGFFWSGNVTMVVGAALSTGGTIVLQPTFEAGPALQIIQKEQVSFMIGRPHQWARLQAVPGWLDADLSCVRYVTRGELIRAHPSVDTSWERPNSFGTTETMTILSAFTPEWSVERKPGAFGTPLPGNTLKIVDPVTELPVARGERGEICIKGPTLMQGYVGKAPEETFDAEGYYRTGDGGYVDEEGRLYWEGRISHMIKTGGANVSPEEVDAAIAAYPGVRRTQTVGVPHETLGEMVVACVVASAGAALTETGLVSYLKERLASFKVPRKVLMLEEQEFVVTGNGKVKVDSMRQLATRRLQQSAASVR